MGQTRSILGRYQRDPFRRMIQFWSSMRPWASKEEGILAQGYVRHSNSTTKVIDGALSEPRRFEGLPYFVPDI